MAVWSSSVARGDDGALSVGGIDVRDLAAEHGTPLYVVDEEDFRARAAAFRDHFAAREHLVMPSASLVPASLDPSVLLTTAGMQPFKPYFLGVEQAPAPRLTSTQKCFRTTDIDEVGKTARHLTFFEMMGNFSIGDYFKADAIAFAWTLVTGAWAIDPGRVWITVFQGDDQVPGDDEARELWLAQGVPAEDGWHYTAVILWRCLP